MSAKEMGAVSVVLIDTLDEQILSELQGDGRLTMKALAEHVGLSSPAMIERVRRLEERGVIASYRAVVTPAAIGRHLTAIISSEVEHRSIPAFLERVRGEPSVVECHRVTGVVNFLLTVHVADTVALEALVDDLGATGARCDTSLVLSSPVPWRPLVPPPGSTRPRTRLSRRRGARETANGETGNTNAEKPRRGRRKATET